MWIIEADPRLYIGTFFPRVDKIDLASNGIMKLALVDKISKQTIIILTKD